MSYSPVRDKSSAWSDEEIQQAQLEYAKRQQHKHGQLELLKTSYESELKRFSTVSTESGLNDSVTPWKLIPTLFVFQAS